MQSTRAQRSRLGSGARLRACCLLVVLAACLAVTAAEPAAWWDRFTPKPTPKPTPTPSPTPRPTPTQTPSPSPAVPAGTACQLPRVRKSWEKYTASEKTLYLNAVGLAMRRGLQQKFVQMHVEFLSELEAHRNCMFVYWHRLYLLGYENMLRSLGPEYICVTIPVWDHLAATARRTAGQCTNMEACAPIISDFGGSKVGVVKNLVVYDQTIPSSTSQLCVNQGVVANFCGNNTVCAGCIVRGPVSTVTYPSDAYFGSVYQQLFTYDTWDAVRSSIEGGVHNTVHSQLGGTMAYFQSPVDPVFYTHHAFIDALQTIYLKCQLNSDTTLLTATQKSSDPRFWASCARRSTGTFAAADEVYMSLQNYANQWVHVRKDPNNLLYQYFKDLPATYAALVDAKDLGVYSYAYDLSGALLNMRTNCRASNTIASTAAVLLAANNSTSSDSADAEHSDGAVSIADSNAVEESAAESATRRWAIALYESARLSGYATEAADEQMELITCLHKHECISAVQDYSAVFRANFHVDGHPRCFTLVQALARGDKVIGIPHWREITRLFVPCANENKAAPSLTSTRTDDTMRTDTIATVD